MSALLRRGAKWTADSFRFLGGAFYWNFRKSIYVLRRRRGQCPCQNESDDSIPGKVRCDAVMHWNEPGRFRKICPLLIQTPEGWRCSVHASQVRPFWGRVVVWTGLAAVAFYLLAVVAVFTGFRVIGRIPVSFAQVAWPANWRELRGAQSEALFKQAMLAFREGRMAEAQLALSTAQARDPKNYEAALLLAQIAMFQRSYLYADDLFVKLWRDHPGQKLRTALVYHDTLLGTDRMDALADWATGIAGEDPPRAAAWVRSALLGVRSMPPSATKDWLKRNDAALRKLAPHARKLIEAEIAARLGGPEAGVRVLGEGRLGMVNPYYLMYHIERLAEWGHAGEAQIILDQVGSVLGDFDLQLTQAAVAKTRGDRTGTQAAFRAVLKLQLNPQRVERIAGFLVSHPDATLYRDLAARLAREPALESAVDGSGLWITAIVCGVPAEAEHWKKAGRHMFASRYPALKALDFRNRDFLAPNTVTHLVNTVSMPREVILSLFEEVVPQVDRPVAPAAR